MPIYLHPAYEIARCQCLSHTGLVSTSADIQNRPLLQLADGCCTPLLRQPITASQAADLARLLKALADPSRRQILDNLHARNGQTLSELCAGLEMSRQAVTQHIGLLEEANIVSVEWQGREKLHYFNPVPIHEIYERWIRKFEMQRLGALHKLKRKLEGDHHE